MYAQQTLGLLFGLMQRHHFGARDLCFRIFDVLLESLLILDDARVFVGRGIAVAGNAAGVAAVQAVELRAD